MKYNLVTGSTGVLGSELVKSLLKINPNLIILKRASSDLSRLIGIKDQFISYNVEDGLSSIFVDHDIETVFHLATAYGRKGESKEDIILSNVNFPSEVLKFSILNDVKNFINFDTSLPGNLNHYASSKKKFRNILESSSSNSSINIFTCN